MLKTFVLALIGFYKAAISPTIPGMCKFHPTCSMYASDAVEAYGIRRGLWMAVKRIVRCRPFHEGGFDPVL
jgi:putative membrane protein insertion efficiency factor